MLNERLSSPPKLVQEFPYNRRGECDRCPGRKQCMELVLAYGRHTAEPLVPCAYGPGYTRNWYIKLYGKIIFSEGWDTPRGFTIKDIMAKSGDGRGRAYDRLRRLMRKGYITAKKGRGEA